MSIKDKNLTSSPAVFLDRDGVINNDVGYFTDPTKLVIPSETINGLIKLNNAGYILIIVTITLLKSFVISTNIGLI